MTKDKSLHLTPKQLGLEDNPMIHDADPLASDKGNDPFGRQPQPVEVCVSGEKIDVDYWFRELSRRAKFKGDAVSTLIPTGQGRAVFKIYPRAVND